MVEYSKPGPVAMSGSRERNPIRNLTLMFTIEPVLGKAETTILVFKGLTRLELEKMGTETLLRDT